MTRRTTRWVVATGLVAIGYLAACSADSTPASSGAPAAPPFPKLASYDRSCTVDADCALVTGEGCASCDVGALNAKAAASYSATYQEASKSAACLDLISRAGPCSQGPAVEPACAASLCGARPVAHDAGADADAAPSDASPD